jgi:hypothetical protein
LTHIFSARIRQKELEKALLEAKNLAMNELREKLALKKRLEYLNFLKFESNLLNHSKQITRAFVFSYIDLLGWLDITN